MFQVALCEDEIVFLQTLKKVCREILEKLNIGYHITAYENSKDFWADFSGEQKRYDLILLDIVMDGMNGMELANAIRKFDRETGIIFVTSNREYVLEGYDVDALHYLMKPVDATTLEKLIKKTYQDKFQNNYFDLRSGSQSQRLVIKDMISLETVGRKVEITLSDKTLYYSGKLTELLGQLPKNYFIRCHQAFAVNIGNIWELNRSNAIAVNGKIIPVSRSYMKDVQTAFLASMQCV